MVSIIIGVIVTLYISAVLFIGAVIANAQREDKEHEKLWF